MQEAETSYCSKHGLALCEHQHEKYWMLNNALSKVAIAIASDSLQQRTNLRRVMSLAGLNVVLSEPLTRLFLRKLQTAGAEVLLLDLHDDIEHDDDLLHEVLDKVEIPIIFNDVTALTLNEPVQNKKWHYSLMQKIAESTGIQNWQADESQADTHKVAPLKTRVKKEHGIAQYVWVLGASLGGPEALKRFLKALPADIPAAFILAQHLGANFVSLLADQLDRTTSLKVMQPEEGHVLLHREVIVAPVDERLIVNPIGNLDLVPLEEQSKYTPSIDMVISDVARRYGKNAGAILFSGMGDDGKLGASRMLEAGGQVWVQSAESCVISSMPDNVRKHCNVSFVGNPEQLAKQLVQHLDNCEVA